MMNACVETTRPFGVKTMVSLNAIMVDGTGMCGSCRVTVGGEVKFACVDGPDFDGHQVDFKELHAAPEALQGPGDRGQRGLRARLQPREAALRARTSATTRSSRSSRRTQAKMPERDAHERARNFKEVNLGYSMADALRRGRALHPVREAHLHRGLPGVDRHPALHPPPAGARHRRRAGGDQRIEPASRRSAAASARRRSQCEAQCVIGQEGRVGGDRPARALRRRQRPAAEGRCRRASSARSARSRSSAPGPAGPGGRGRPACATAARSPSSRRCTWSAACCVRHPVLPPAARHHRPRGRSTCKDVGVKFETNKVIGKTFTVAAAHGRDGLRRGVRRRRRRRAVLPRHPGRVRRPGLFGQRVPHPRQPDGRRPLPLPRHADHARQERGRDRRRQHRDGLPARGQAPRRADRALRLPPLARPRRRRASRSCATPRRRASSSSSCTRRSRSSSTTTATCAA